MIITGWLIYAVCYAGFGFVGNGSSATPGVIVLLFLLYGTFYAFSEGIEKSFVADLVGHTERKGFAFGVLSFSVGVMSFPASLLFGAVVEHLNEKTAFLAAASVALLAAVTLWFAVPEKSKTA